MFRFRGAARAGPGDGRPDDRQTEHREADGGDADDTEAGHREAHDARPDDAGGGDAVADRVPRRDRGARDRETDDGDAGGRAFFLRPPGSPPDHRHGDADDLATRRDARADPSR